MKQVHTLPGCFALTLCLAAPLAAQPGPSWFDPTRVDDAPVAATVRSSHSGEYNGSSIAFDVIAGELLLNGIAAEEGGVAEPAATMFSIAYVRTDEAAAGNRPVLFLFNGGPGASSSPLHLGIGPMRRPEGDDEGALVPNPLSPIDAVDMVFVDPVGTGFTRLLKEGAGEQFWGIKPDADSVLLLIKTWLEQNGRTASPVFIMGESYGGTRAAAMAGQAKDVTISGVLLLSPALDFSAGAAVVGNNLPYLFLLPSMAATAVYHGVVEANGRSYLQVFNDAATYAQSEFAAALFKGNTIGAAEKQAVARRLSELIGLSADYIEAQNLRIDSWDFGDRLLVTEAMRTGHLDARAKGLLADYKDQRPPGNDPSMAGGKRGGDGGRGTGEVLEEYFRDTLGVKIDRPYRTLNLDLNQKWDYGQKQGFTSYISVAPQLQQAMQANPDLRVWVGGGVFDLGTPIMAARYVTNQIDAAPGRFVFAGYEGGHTVFEHEESRRILCDDIRRFVAETIALKSGAVE
jgi:carboxypeptidase C (cathepsin A)